MNPPKMCVRCQKNPKKPRATKYCEQCLDELKPIWEQNRYKANLNQRLKKIKELSESGKRQKVTSVVCPPGTKWCPICQEFLELSKFRKTKTRYDGYCKVCFTDLTYSKSLTKKYGIDYSQYLELLRIQDDRCFICRNKPKRIRLAVDHNHKTGEVRGLLCTKCNQHLLGAAHDNVDILKRAVEYLENPPARTILPK